MEVERTIVNKVKENIKRLDTKINIAHNSTTSHLFIIFSSLAAIAKYITVIATQAYTFQAKATAQAHTSFSANATLRLY